MVIGPAPRTSPLEVVGLVLLAAAPAGWLIGVGLASAGRDLTVLFLVGLGLLFVVGAWALVSGNRQGRDGRAAAGEMCVGLTVLFFALAGLGVADILWVGREAIPLTVQVRDAATEKPVPHATVRLFIAGREDEVTVGQTAADGTVQLSREFRTAGASGLVRSTGGIHLARETLAVEAEGYRPLQEPLGTFVPPAWPLYGPPLPTIEVSLSRP